MSRHIRAISKSFMMGTRSVPVISSRAIASQNMVRDDYQQGNNVSWRIAAIGALVVGLAIGQGFEKKAHCVAETETHSSNVTPRITLAKIRALRDEGRVVVSFQGKVYDVTDFTGHPGGFGRLEMASGHDLEPFWRVYTQHNRGHIVDEILVRYIIGELSPEEAEEIRNTTVYDNPYKNDPGPETFPELLTNTRHPYNAEGRLRDLRKSWVTPIGRHFVRNHSMVPDIKPEEYQLHISGFGLNDTTFTLEDLKTKFPKVEVTTVIQCNGNRREDFHYADGVTPAFGPPHWVAGAIANSTWAGCRLRDVLREAGMDVDGISLGKVQAPKEATFVGLTGYDHDEVGNQYCCSFPFEKAVDPFGDVILAYEMNGVDIPRSHGYPVRAIVPGHAGARNCKYLEKITVNNFPCCDACNWKQYAVHAPDVSLFKLADFEVHAKELKQDPAVQEMPVQSFITSPSAGDTLAVTLVDGVPSVMVKGIAWGGGGEGINRVDVTLDGGKHFTRADLLPNPIQQRRGGQWSWVFFEKIIPVPENMVKTLNGGQHVDLELASKALNTSWNVQPERAEPNLNPHGCCVNHWYRVPVKLCPVAKEDTPAPEGDFGNKPSGGYFRRPFRNLEQPCPNLSKLKAKAEKKV